MDKQKLEEFKKSIASVTEKLTEIKAYCDCDPAVDCEVKCDCVDYSYLSDALSYINSRVNDFYNTFYSWVSDHIEGHLPKIESVEQMQNAIEALGLSAEYEVAKKVIYSSIGQPEKLIFEFTKK